MLLLIGPVRDGRHNTYICRGSDRQIEPLGPDVFDVVSDVLEIVRDIITVSVHLVDIWISLLRGFRTERHFIAVNKVIIKEKLEMTFASPLALFLVSVSQLHTASPYWPANRRSFAIASSALHSCWDKITVKNRRGDRGSPEPLEPSPGYAPA